MWRFHSFRHRRLLPFAAVYALVCINGATLAPFVAPACIAGSASAADGPETSALANDAWRWLQYERADAADPAPAIAAAPPPIVKNLRRLSPSGPCEHAARRLFGRHPTVPRLDSGFMHRALAANAADLSRLRRPLL